MKIQLTIITLFLFPIWMNAQTFQIDKPSLPIDSLKKALPLLHGRARVDCLNELSRSYIDKYRPLQTDSAPLLSRQAYALASAIHYSKGLGNACLLLGVIYQWHFFKAAEAEKYFRQAISWYQKIQDQNGLGHGFRGLGMQFHGRPDEAMNAFKQSMVHFRKAGNSIMLAELIDLIGSVYGMKGNLEMHFEHVKKGLQEKKRIGDHRGMVWSYYRLGHISQLVGDYETALDYFRQSLQQANSQAIPWGIYNSMGTVFLNLKNYDSSLYYFGKMVEVNTNHTFAQVGLGRTFLAQNEYGKALEYFQQSLSAFKKKDYLQGEITVLLDMGKSYASMKKHKAALQHARAALAMDKEKSKSVVLNAWEIHWKVYDDLQLKDSAYFYFKKFVALRDSLNDARVTQQYLQKLALFKVATKLEQQQAMIDLLHKGNQIKQQQLQKEALHKKILVGSLAAIVLLSLMVFRYIVLKGKNEKHLLELAENELQIQRLESERIKAEWQQQAVELEMQALRAQMNPHFIFNSLNAINRFILKKQSSEATGYLTKFSRLIRMILNSSASSTISLTEELAALQLYLELESLRFDEKFHYKIQCHPDVDADFVHIPPMLLQPFVENAIWHGLMHKEAEGHLCVNIFHEASTLICTITDDGIGREKAAEVKSKSVSAHKSLGMRITFDRMALWQMQKQLNTSIQVTDLSLPDGSSGGTKVLIKIPIAYD